jgi:hypothetical protein
LFCFQKRFPNKTALNVHMVSHKTERDYHCPDPGCDFQTKYKSYLTLHGRMHTGRAHACDFKGCSYTTLKLSLLKCHKRTHTKERIFVCPECQVRSLYKLTVSRDSFNSSTALCLQKGFVEKSQLTRHRRTAHSDEKPFACWHCKYSAKRKDKLKAHVLRLHAAAAAIVTEADRARHEKGD